MIWCSTIIYTKKTSNIPLVAWFVPDVFFQGNFHHPETESGCCPMPLGSRWELGPTVLSLVRIRPGHSCWQRYVWPRFFCCGCVCVCVCVSVFGETYGKIMQTGGSFKSSLLWASWGLMWPNILDFARRSWPSIWHHLRVRSTMFLVVSSCHGLSCCNMVDVRPDVGQRSLAVNLLRNSSTLALVGAVVLRRPDWEWYFIFCIRMGNPCSASQSWYVSEEFLLL